MDDSFMVHGCGNKIAFIKFLRAIAPLLKIKELGLKDAKTIADQVAGGRPLRIWTADPDLTRVLKNYARAIGADTELMNSYMDFHGEVNKLVDAREAADRLATPGWGDEWDDTVIPAGTPLREDDPVTFGEWDWDAPEHPWNEAELVPVEDWDDPAVPVWDYTDEPDEWQAEKVREDHAPREDSRDELPTQTPSDWDWDRDFDDCLIDGDDGAGQTLTPLADAYLRNHGGSQ